MVLGGRTGELREQAGVRKGKGNGHLEVCGGMGLPWNLYSRDECDDGGTEP
jgi:hypothetical protein